MTSLWIDRSGTLETDPFEPGARVDDIVVGAGLTGLTTAVLLARAGRRVTVLEARSVGVVATGRSTAKLSLLQGSQLQQIASRNTRGVLQAYVDGNRAAQTWMLDWAAGAGIDVQRRTAYSYAGTDSGVSTVLREQAVAESTGLPVYRTTTPELPYSTRAAVALDDQAQFDPMHVLRGLAAELRSLGGHLVTGVRVTGVDSSHDPVDVRTDHGDIGAEHVVLATGSPVLDRGLYWAKLKPQRSYALAFTAPQALPQGMYLSVDSPTRSVRSAPGDHDGERLIIGGNGHTVGRASSPAALVDELTDWTLARWPGAQRTHAWSAQDYEAPQRIPFVGIMPRTNRRVSLATGYDKWGMTNAVAAALTIVGDRLGGTPDWARTLHHRVTLPLALAEGLGANLAVGWWYARGWARTLATPLPQSRPAEGEGVTGRRGIRPVAVSTVDGRTCELSAVCPHLHAVLNWNDQERTWDCPAHGSRFAADGALLEGPATRDLRPAGR